MRRSEAQPDKSSRLQPYAPLDNLNNALGSIRVLGLELTEDELRPHLNTVLSSIRDKNRGAPEQVVISGILPVLALSLRNRGSPAVLKLVSELAKETVVRKGFSDSGLVPALLSVLTSPDQDLLIPAARAVSHMTHENPKLQDQCLCCGAVPRLVSVLFRFAGQSRVEQACVEALCSVSGMVPRVDEEGDVLWRRGVSAGPGESVFTSGLTLVRVSQWGPGQCSVSVEQIHRCSWSFWSLYGTRPSSRGSGLYRVIKYPSRARPRTKNLKTRMFHTFL